MADTHRIIDSLAIVRWRGGPEGREGSRWSRYVNGSLENGGSGRLHTDPVRAVILSEGGAAKETIRRSTISCGARRSARFAHLKGQKCI